MAGQLDIPKFVDYRNEVKRHSNKTFPVLDVKDKTTIAIHHSLTKQGKDGSNAEDYARYHVDTHGWPSIGYSYVIEEDGTIKWVNDIELRTYHVGNHNNYAVGVCLTGDFRSEEPTDAQKESLRHLVSALQSQYPHIKYVKGHNEFSGYEWKQCPMFDYKAVLNQGEPKAPVPAGKHEIQEGDTLWSIAKGKDFDVDDLKKVNADIKPTQLKVGDVVKLPNSSDEQVDEKPKANLKIDGKWGKLTTRALQRYLGTPIDSVISNQVRNHVTAQIVSGITFGDGGSLVIRALQKLIGAKEDGYLGPKTIEALQQYLGTVVDGKLSDPSLVVETLQRALNEGSF
ncbi:N-acetylmuramoyl-L-alanine amidase [Alkalibacillus salilacus]|uniref:Autolysin n=1 Tax=Alkalibacillus salilacus TaxID=284582 RepID=A0ABT9VDA6_9BACI|nr:N-acetylmuramoyl-L-alanine amidase [Alkalibacillus salilacus]MDQ0158949.1 LysM repeat protein [Alkalibacillus salilacus]